MFAHAANKVIVEVGGLEHFFDDIAWGLLHHAAKMLAIEAPPINVADVALRPFDGQFFAIEHFAANLDAAIAGAVFEAYLKAQLEIPELALAAQECVETKALRERSANERAFAHLPVFGQSFP